MMNLKILIKNFSYTITSNLLSLLISMLIVLIVPKLIGVQDYSYWQLYLFYAAYVGFLHFGWSDGIYLRQGGKEYKSLEKEDIFSQFIMLVAMQFMLGALLFVIIPNIITDSLKGKIIQLLIVTMVITNIRSMPLLILQAVNRIKDYAKAMIIDRVIYFLLIMIILLLGYKDFKFLIFADIMSRIISLVYLFSCCKDILIRPMSDFKMNINEALLNIHAGIKLLLAYISSQLIIGVVRFGIENSWDIVTFGKISLTLSASNLMLVFINAISLILFPVLRRINMEKLPTLYINMRNTLTIISFSLLLFYYPSKCLLSYWLPHYSENIEYMALVFPIFIFEGRIAMMINTFMKTLRKEGTLLIVNIIVLGLSILSTYILTIVLRNLELTVLSISLLLIIKSLLAENFISKVLAINIYKEIALELILTMIFILSSWFINSWITIIIYGIAYISYILIKRNDLIKIVDFVKQKQPIG